MARYSPSVQNLISKLGSLPGIGGKSAQKLAFSILAMSQEEADALTGAIVEARRLTKRCSICQNFTDSDPCPICSDPKRDTSTVCVVESPSEVSVFERINPVGNMNMNDITISELFARLTEHPEIKEVIVATNQNAEGNATALYISRLLGSTGIKVTRLASGLPMGSDIKFADDLTLANALKGRKQVGS